MRNMRKVLKFIKNEQSKQSVKQAKYVNNNFLIRKCSRSDIVAVCAIKTILSQLKVILFMCGRKSFRHSMAHTNVYIALRSTGTISKWKGHENLQKKSSKATHFRCTPFSLLPPLFLSFRVSLMLGVNVSVSSYRFHHQKDMKSHRFSNGFPCHLFIYGALFIARIGHSNSIPWGIGTEGQKQMKMKQFKALYSEIVLH